MHIRKIVIENIRCFDRVELDLTRPDGSLAGWTVLAGRNGTGKSTLLKAIALGVSGDEAFREQKNLIGWIRNGSQHAQVDVFFEQPSNSAHDERAIFKCGMRLDSDVAETPSMGINDYHSNRLPWDMGGAGAFVAGYGPTRRLGFRDSYEEPGTQIQARLATLFDEDATLAESIHWLKDIHADHLNLLHHANILESNDDKKKADELRENARRLNTLYENVVALLSDGLLPEGERAVGLDERREFIIERNGVQRRIRSLSDGYRSTIALVTDIVRQMYRCFNDKLEVSQRIIDGKPVVQVDHEGVVLIDEVDAHLHVSWQQRIGFWLKKHFPNVQFIVTTHSPFICQAADPKGLIRLPVPGSNEHVEHVSEDLYYTVVNGDADDAVMTALFGLERPHSEEAEKLRSQVAKLEVKHLRGLATPEEKENLKQLSAQLPKTGSALVQQALRKLGEMG